MAMGLHVSHFANMCLEHSDSERHGWFDLTFGVQRFWLWTEDEHMIFFWRVLKVEERRNWP
jgi:hypothetical protein